MLMVVISQGYRYPIITQSTTLFPRFGCSPEVDKTIEDNRVVLFYLIQSFQKGKSVTSFMFDNLSTYIIINTISVNQRTIIEHLLFEHFLILRSVCYPAMEL